MAIVLDGKKLAAKIAANLAADIRDREFMYVGMHRSDSNTIFGDVPAYWTGMSHAYAPVPGGIGPMTVAMLMCNVIRYYDIV